MLRLTRLTQGKAYLLIARYRFRVPIPSEGEEFRESEEQWHPKGVSSVGRGLVGHRADGRGDDPRRRCAGGGEQVRVHVGDAFLASVNPAFAPDFARSTATGDRLQLSGTGTFNAGARRVDGGGTFVHTHADGTLFADGTWLAIGVVSWRSYGNG